MLVIRHSNENTVVYEGNWGDESEKILALRLLIGGKYHYGWARLQFKKDHPDYMTLVDHAWNKMPEQRIYAGQR